MASSDRDWTLESLSFDHSTDLKHRLRSHSPVSPLEAAQIAAYLSEAEAEVLYCDDEISQEQNSPDTVIFFQTARKQLKSRVYGFRSLLSPIRKLPIELLTEIFSHCRIVYCRGTNRIRVNNIWPDQDGLGKSALSILTAVCPTWRNIIISDPRLWSTMFVHGRQSGVTRVELLELYLERSGNLPLILDVGDFYHDPVEISIMNCLITHSRRWRDVRIEVNLGDDTAVEIFNRLTGNLPILEAFHFTAYYLANPIFGFETTPRLRSLTLQYTPLITFPWRGIIYLERRGTNVHRFLKEMKLCPNLESARLICRLAHVVEGTSEGADAVRSVVELPKLRSFSMEISELEIEGLGCISTLFDVAKFPKVTTIMLSSKHRGSFSSPWPQNLFKKFLWRSSCSLSILSLIQIPISETDLISLLSLLRCLTSLTFAEVAKTEENPIVLPSISNTLFHALNTDRDIADPSRSTLLPKLQYLDLQAGGSAVSEEDFIQMVRSRWWPARSYSRMHRSACLRTAFLTVTERSWNPSMVKPLLDLRKAGMRIMVYAMVAPSPQERENREAQTAITTG